MPIAIVKAPPPASLVAATLSEQALRVLRITAQQWGMCPVVANHSHAHSSAALLQAA